MGGYNDQRYSVELLADDGGSVEQVLAREERLEVARMLYELMQAQYRDRIIVLRDRERIIERSCGH